MDNNKLYKLAQQVLKSRTQGTGMNQTTKSIVEIKNPKELDIMKVVEWVEVV